MLDGRSVQSLVNIADGTFDSGGSWWEKQKEEVSWTCGEVKEMGTLKMGR